MEKINAEENYPSPFEILSTLQEECILVGSYTYKPFAECKDIDFVISEKGVQLLQKYEYYLTWYSLPDDAFSWSNLIPYEKDHKVLEFFHGICPIVDEYKHANRITYEEAVLKPLGVQIVYGVNVLALLPQ